MQYELDFLLSLFCENEITAQIPPEVLENERLWASGWLFSSDPVHQKLLSSPDVEVATKRMIIETHLERLKDNRLFWEKLVQLEGERKRILKDRSASGSGGDTFRMNTVESSPIQAGGNVHIGNKNDVKLNIHLNEQKKPEIRCPNCQTVAPAELTEVAEKEGASFGIDCPNCRSRYYPITNLAGNVSLYRHLSPRDSETFNHLVNAVESDLKLGNSQKAYERCERLKEQYGKEGAIYEYCALTYFYATPIDNIIHNSARFIFVYLDDAKQRNPDSETYPAIAGTIALGYAQRLKSYLAHERAKIPVKRKPVTAKPDKKELAEIEKAYRQAVTVWRSKLLRILDEYETAYRIFPMDEFLKTGVRELCGHNGTPWFNLRFRSLFFPPPQPDLNGFVWDYYDLTSNMTHFDGKVNNRPEELLNNWYQTIRIKQPDFPMPDILIGGETTLGAVTIKSRLVKNGFIFWAVALALFILGFLIGNTYTIIFSVILLVAALIKFKDVKNSISNLFSNL